MFSTLRRDITTSVLLDLFLGENRIEVRPSIKTILLNATVDYPNSHSLMFGAKNYKNTSPILVIKALVILIVTGLLGYKISSIVVEGVNTLVDIYAHTSVLC